MIYVSPRGALGAAQARLYSRFPYWRTNSIRWGWVQDIYQHIFL
ncbi:hypothetical protein [Nostoc sp. FACHB-110]|nr:hypothetical protein [Nostoc sp. FACHB-110]